MPTTTNFGWTTPADTDLVKDGASAIRTLGNGIDASLLDLKGGTTGQVLSKNSNTDLDFTWIAAGASPASASATVTTEQTTTSTSYTDLTTSGPAVTLTTGTKALVIVTCSSKTSEAGYIVRASYAVSGATTIAANDDVAIWNQFNDNIRYSAVSRLNTLTAGSNTFTMKYRINNATRTATFGYREICVIDLGS